VDEIHERMRFQEILQSELNEAAEYVKALLPNPIQEEKITIDWRFEPCSSLGGDAFGYHWIGGCQVKCVTAFHTGTLSPKSITN
jgi:sigma-B regulation protein RsbU (phosphoserine phosphatase)